MLKKITLTALLIALPLSATMIYAEDVEPPSSIESAQNIVVDDEYDATTEIIEEVEVVEEQTIEQVEEVVVEEVIEEVEETQEQEQEVVEEITEEEVTEEETTEEDKLELQPAPMMTMAAPKMLGASKEAEHNIVTNDYPITFKFSWYEIQRGKAVCNTSYSFNGNGWEQYTTYGWQQNAYGWYKLDNSGSENNVYATLTYTPKVAGSKMKLFKDVGETDTGIDPSFSSWTVAKAETQSYAGRYKSRMRNCDNDNQKWTFGMSGWGRQRIWPGTKVTQTVDEEDRDGICTFSGYWGVICERSNGDLIIDTDDLSPNGGVLGTVNLRIEINHDWFYEFLG